MARLFIVNERDRRVYASRIKKLILDRKYIEACKYIWQNNTLGVVLIIILIPFLVIIFREVIYPDSQKIGIDTLLIALGMTGLLIVTLYLFLKSKFVWLEAILWILLCGLFPVGYARMGQWQKGLIWLLIVGVSFGIGGVPMLIDYFMCASKAQTDKPLEKWEWYPR